VLQITIDDWLTDLNRPESELKAGQRIYKLILDVVETGIIDHMWDMPNGWGYAAKKDNGCFITLYTPDVGDTVFTDAKEAYSKAESLRNTYKVIRAKDMEILKEKTFVNTKGKKRLETVKLLEGNMIYFDKFPRYPFLEIFDTEAKAEKRFNECVKEIIYNINYIPKIETDENLPAIDMYLAENGNWSRYDYVGFNGAVLNDEDY
jgi:hypothetical protein